MARERPTDQGPTNNQFFLPFFPKTLLSAERSVWVSCRCRFFVVAFFFSWLAFVAKFWRAVRGPQNGPTAVQIGFRRSEILTIFCFKFKHLKWEFVQKHYKNRGFKQNEGSKNMCQKWPIWKAVRDHRGGQFRDHIHVSFSDLHGGRLTACSVGPELPFKRLLSAERSVFFTFCGPRTGFLGRGQVDPLATVQHIYIYICRRVVSLSTFWPFWELLVCPPFCPNLIFTAGKSILRVISLST